MKITRFKFYTIFLSIALFLAAWAFWLEPAYFRIKHYSIKVESLANTLNSYKVAVIADIHIGSPHNSIDRLKKIVKLTNAEKPDLILIVGDIVIDGVVGGNFVHPRKIAAELKKLQAKEGVYAVLGNHDWWFDPEVVTKEMTKNNIQMLDESSSLIERDSGSFWLMGIGDLWEGRPDIEGNLRKIKDDRPIIAFTHNPDVFENMSSRVALTFAGHTHGGQVFIPLLGRLVVPSDYGEKYAIGHVQNDDRHLFVSPGVGTSILPVRFLVPPEVSIVTIN